MIRHPLSATVRRCRGDGPSRPVLPAGLATAALAAVLGLVCLLPSALQAQQVQGRLVDEVDARPLAGAYVTLVRGGVNVARTVTRVDGGFTLTAPEAGSYLLRADFLGYGVVERTVEIPPPGEALRVELAAAQQAIELEGLVAEVDRQCDVPETIARQVASLWDEVAEAFRVTAFMEEEQLFDMRMDRWERSLEPGGLRVLDERRRQGRGIQRGSPFESLPPEELARDGYVREMEDGSFEYYAPDARVLLSASFQDTHCFGVTIQPPRDGDEDWVGIRFEPRNDRVTDIRGALWIDGGTLEPRRLDYRYSELPGRVGSPELGGRVVFQRLPEGPWIIREWWIRMPRVQAVQYYTFSSSEVRYRYEIAGIEEVGGRVTQAGPRGGELVALGETGGLEGRVLESSGAPAAGARVALEGTGYRTRSGPDGRFALAGLPEGRYRLAHSSPFLDSLELDGGRTPVAVTAGEVTRVEIRLPAPAALLAEACTEPVKPDEVGVLRGVVAPPAGGSLDGVWVELSWAEGFSLDEVAGDVWVGESTAIASLPVDDEGRWMACGLPTDIPLRARAVVPEVRGARGSAQDLRLRADEFPTLRLQAPATTVAESPAPEGDVSDAAATRGDAADDPTGREARILQELANLGLRRETLGRRFAGPDEVEERRQGSMDAVDLVRVLGLPGIRVRRDRSGQLCIYSSRNVRGSRSGGTPEPVCAAIVLDGVPSDIRQLQSVPGESVAALAYLRPGEAGARFGGGTAGGVMVVWTLRGDR